MKTLDELQSALAHLISVKQLRKLVLSRPKKTNLLRTEGHLFEKDGQVYLQLESFLTDGKAIHKNIPSVEAAEAVFALLLDEAEGYAQLNLLSPLGDGEARRTAKGKWLVGGKIALTDGGEAPIPIAAHNHEKQYILQEGEPYPFLIRLGICAPDGRILDKKRPKFLQINKFLENVEAIYDALPRDGVLRILDLCCGKSYLTFAVYHYLTGIKGRQVEMLGADLKSDVIAYCSDMAAKLGYRGLSFVCCDIGDLSVPFPPDLVLSLHACDIATDIVLAKAIVTRAKVILSTPCCHHELMGQITKDGGEMNRILSAVTEHSLLRQKLSEALTDALRARMLEANGYDVTLTELIDPEQTPKNLLIRALRKDISDSKRQALLSDYEALCRFGNLDPFLAKILSIYREQAENAPTEID